MPAVKVLDQDTAGLQALEHFVRVGHADEYEIGLRRKHRRARQPLELRLEPRAPGADRGRLLGDPARVGQERLRGGLSQRIHIIRLADLVQLRDPFRRGDGIAEADARHADLRHRAQHQQIGKLGDPRQEARVRKRVIRLVDDDESRRSSQHRLDVARGEQVSGRIVRVREVDERRTVTLDCGEHRGAIEAEIASEGHADEAHAGVKCVHAVHDE